MTITPEKLRDYARREFHEYGFESDYSRAFREAADEIERLTGVPYAMMQREQSTATAIAAQVEAGMKKLKP